jgi:hypothetical protein
MEAERTILALRDDRPLEALKHAWVAHRGYPLDYLHVAERVLTISELRSFVDTLEDSYGEPHVDKLRSVLARRLMRAGRFGDALPYMDIEHRTDAALFGSAMSRVDHGDKISRAHALYEASRMARRHGMEILGTERQPDWAMENGSFDLTKYGFTGGWPSKDPAPWVSRGERARIERHRPAFRERYHYRYLASALAEQAADLLPPRSQAFAAVLCHATRYVFMIDGERRNQLYRRYVREGATVDFASTFGQECPEPEFERARKMFPEPESEEPGHLPFTIPLGFVLMLFGIRTLRWYRRRTAPISLGK